MTIEKLYIHTHTAVYIYICIYAQIITNIINVVKKKNEEEARKAKRICGVFAACLFVLECVCVLAILLLSRKEIQFEELNNWNPLNANR